MDNPFENLLYALKERAKELKLAFMKWKVLFSKPGASLSAILEGESSMPFRQDGKYPDVCLARITYGESIVFSRQNFKEKRRGFQSADVIVPGRSRRKNKAFIMPKRGPMADEGPFPEGRTQSSSIRLLTVSNGGLFS